MPEALERRVRELERKAPHPPRQHEELPLMVTHYPGQDRTEFQQKLDKLEEIKAACPNCRDSAFILLELGDAASNG